MVPLSFSPSFPVGWPLVILMKKTNYISQIRNKRLARLGAQASPSSTPSQSEASKQSDDATPLNQQPDPSLPTQQDGSQRPQTNISGSSTPTQMPQPSSAQETRPRIRVNQSTSQQSISPLKRDSGGTPTSGSSRPVVRAPESPEVFEDRTLSAVFRISLDNDKTEDIHGTKLRYLPGVRQELEEEGQSVRIHTGILDQALLEAASGLKNNRPLTYLLPCWKRISRLFKGFKKPNSEDPKYEIVKEARRLCMSYCIFAATMPEMFG